MTNVAELSAIMAKIADKKPRGEERALRACVDTELERIDKRLDRLEKRLDQPPSPK